MFILNGYLITTGICAATAFVYNAAFRDTLKLKGYSFKELSTEEKDLLYAYNLFKISFPIYNIICSLNMLIKDEKMFVEWENELLESGMIYKNKELTLGKK